MTVRSRRRLAFFLILSTAAFLSLQLSGISFQDFDNAGQMQDNFALPTSHKHGSLTDQGAQDIQSSKNTLQKLKQSVDSVNNHLVIQKDKTHTNHDRLVAGELGNKNNAKIHLRNLAASKLQESVDNDGGISDNHKRLSATPSLVSVTETVNATRPQTTKQNNPSRYKDVVRNLANIYQTIAPSIFQEENCPVCFGTSFCDQFYGGNIRWNKSSAVTLQKNVYTYDGTWIEESQDRHLRVTIKQFSNHRMLDNYICQMTSSNYSPTDPDSKCDVSTRVLRTKLASTSATNQQYVRNEIGKLQYRQSTLFSLSKCASQRFLDILNTEYQPTNVAMLSTALILNPQSLLLKFIHNHIPQLSHYFPSYHGECGHTIVQESISSYTSLKQYLPKSWLERVDLALQLLKMVEDFTTASPDWLVFFGNISYETLAVSTEGSIKVISLDDVMIVDRVEINKTLATLSKTTEPCNEDCLYQYATSITNDPSTQCGQAGFYSQLMYMLVCQRFLSDLASTKVIRFFDHKNMDWADHPGGLLRDPPYELDLRLTELLYECIFESKPGVRRTVSKTLKKMLYVIKRSKIGSAYW